MNTDQIAAEVIAAYAEHQYIKYPSKLKPIIKAAIEKAYLMFKEQTGTDLTLGAPCERKNMNTDQIASEALRQFTYRYNLSVQGESMLLDIIQAACEKAIVQRYGALIKHQAYLVWAHREADLMDEVARLRAARASDSQTEKEGGEKT